MDTAFQLSSFVKNDHAAIVMSLMAFHTDCSFSRRSWISNRSESRIFEPDLVDRNMLCVFRNANFLSRIEMDTAFQLGIFVKNRAAVDSIEGWHILVPFNF